MIGTIIILITMLINGWGTPANDQHHQQHGDLHADQQVGDTPSTPDLVQLRSNGHLHTGDFNSARWNKMVINLLLRMKKTIIDDTQVKLKPIVQRTTKPGAYPGFVLFFTNLKCSPVFSVRDRCKSQPSRLTLPYKKLDC